MSDQLRVNHGEREALSQIDSEWLGPETRVYPLPRAPVDGRRVNRRPFFSGGQLFISFRSGIAMGTCLAVCIARVEDSSVVSGMVKT